MLYKRRLYCACLSVQTHEHRDLVGSQALVDSVADVLRYLGSHLVSGVVGLNHRSSPEAADRGELLGGAYLVSLDDVVRQDSVLGEAAEVIRDAVTHRAVALGEAQDEAVGGFPEPEDALVIVAADHHVSMT